jgi:hypothetical protein
MRYFTKSLCLTFNKEDMNMTKARIYKALKSNNQTRKRQRSDNERHVTNTQKRLHTNSIKNHSRQFNLRHNTIKNFTPFL